MPAGYVKLQNWMGVNFNDPPTEIADNELAQARNCFPYEMGTIGPRFVQRVVENAFNPGTGKYDKLSKLSGALNFPAADDSGFELGLYSFVDSTGAQQLVQWIPFVGNGSIGVNKALLGVFTRTLANLSGIADSPIIVLPGHTVAAGMASILPREAGFPHRPGSLVYNNELYLFPGHTYAGLALGSANLASGPGGLPQFRELGTTWTAFTGATGDRPKFTFGDVYRDVFVLGGAPPPYESLVFFTQGVDSAGNAQPAWFSLLSAAKTAAFGFGDGDRLMRIVSTPILGGAAAVEPYALALKQRSVWLMQGSPPTATSNGTLVVTPVMRREGLVAPDAVCTTPYGIVWCSGRNVWLMPPGQQPVPVGNKIQKYLASLPATPSAAWFLEYHDDVLYLNFPSPNALVDGSDFVSGAARQYLPSQQMWCDLRKPDEPKWWGPQDVRCSHMRSLNFADGSKQLTGLVPYWENTSTYVIQPFTMAEQGTESQDVNTGSTVSRGYDLADPGPLSPTWFTPPAVSTGDPAPENGQFSIEQVPVSVMQMIRTREMSFGDDTLEKIIERVEVNAAWDLRLGLYSVLDLNETNALQIANDRPLALKLIKNGGLVISGAKGPPGATGATTSTPETPGFVLDISRLDGSASPSGLARVFIPVAFFPPNSSRFVARTFQGLLVGFGTFDTGSADEAFDWLVRKFRLKSLTITARPIGRRPGGSYGG